MRVHYSFSIPLRGLNSVVIIEKPLELLLAFYFLLSKLEQNDHFRFDGLFVTFPKLQTILVTIWLLITKSHLFFGVSLGAFIF